MKAIEISDEDYRILEWLGSDKWMTVKGEKPLPVKKVLHEVIQKEYNKANPKKYGGYEY